MRDHEVQVISDPPGARIEVNDDYVGDAPLTIKMAGNKDGVGRRYVVRAIPIIDGQFTQTKIFVHTSRESDPIPLKILFDMHLLPPKDLNIGVDVKSR